MLMKSAQILAIVGLMKTMIIRDALRDVQGVCPTS